MTGRLLMEALRPEHLPDLAEVLRQAEVYQHIGGLVTLEEFIRDREIALRGPLDPAEHWLNVLVRERETGEMVGRLEATVHQGLAEVAFLFAPRHWGWGLASEALAWLHEDVRRRHGVESFWATTVPANSRCQALLTRAGYVAVRDGWPALRSWDEGDLVFHRQAAP